MKFPWDVAKPLRVEVALNPSTEAPVWRDISALVKGDGVRITRGGGGRHEMSPPGRCSFTLDNRDGAFSDVSGMALSLYRKRVRVSYRTPGVAGNLLDAETASFEGGTVGSWAPFGSVPPTLSVSTLHPQVGSKGMLIAWGTGGVLPNATAAITGMVVGRAYTVSAYVWVPTGSPAVSLKITDGYLGTDATGAASTTFGAMERIWCTFTATTANRYLAVSVAPPGTAGRQCFIDAIQLDEGAAAGTFTTAAPPISYRFTGRIATNDLSFPSLGRALTSLTATDETAWQGSTFATLRAVPVQEILSDSPAGLWTLADGDLGDSSGAGGGALTLAGVGALPTAGALIASATTAAGVTFAAGQYYGAALASKAGWFLSDGVVLEAAVRTVSTTEGAIVAAAGGYGPELVISMDADGKPRARRWQVFTPGVYDANAVSTVAINDGQPHHVAARWTIATGVLNLFVDGVLRGTSTATTGSYVVTDRITVGGTNVMANFNGLVAHVAITDSPLSNARIADHAAALLTGFNGEVVTDRLARYSRWAGDPFGTPVAYSALKTAGHYDTEGKSVTDAIAAIAAVEDGMAYMSGDGRIALRGRPTFVSATATAVLAGPGAGQASCMREGLTYSTDPRIVVNDVSGTMPGGITDRAIHSASIAEYGRAAESIEAPFASLAEMTSVINWRVNTEAIPQPQVEGLSVRMSQLDDATTTPLLAVDLGHVIGWTDMPSQAPAATSSGVVLSIDETYSQNDLLWTATVSPNYGGNVLIADDPVRGLADSGFIAAY